MKGEIEQTKFALEEVQRVMRGLDLNLTEQMYVVAGLCELWIVTRTNHGLTRNEAMHEIDNALEAFREKVTVV